MKVTQIRVFPATSEGALQKEVNEFLIGFKDDQVYDVKFECIPTKEQGYVYSCLVIYAEGLDEAEAERT